ncbi:gluconokinase [Mesorhizobium sp. 1B3]|uniref:gluconokinase n=1 Tax=Mesorhizobium sp. 1B3 TaxID=3243599 RepID=UPI003D95A303
MGTEFRSEAPKAIVLMGVAGSGKSFVGEALARNLGWRFIEGDALHPPANVARMAAGQPLTDEDRQGWLDAIGQDIATVVAQGQGVVATCSALKRIYRDRLRGWCEGILFVHVAIDKETARRRVGSRKGHFMPASLVDSQFATLEPPATGEPALTLDGTLPLKDILARITTALGAS